MSELSKQNLRNLGLVETNVERLDDSLHQLHRAACQMDLDQLRVFMATELGQEVFGLINTFTQYDQGMRRIPLRMTGMAPKPKEILVCDGCGATEDDFGQLFNPGLSVNKSHRELCVSALGCEGLLRLRELSASDMKKQTSKLTLQHFTGLGDVLCYITSELLATLQDDLIRMDGREAEHYDDEDRETMRRKIADIEKIAPFIEQLHMAGSEHIESAAATDVKSPLYQLVNCQRLLQKAADYVEKEAETLKQSMTIGGDWDLHDDVDLEARNSYDQDTLFASELRAAADSLTYC